MNYVSLPREMVKIGNTDLGKYPVFLAPMEDVTTPVFRSVCKSFGVDMMFTEFISSEGIIRGGKKGMEKLDIGDEERPIGIQIYGHIIESMVEAAMIAEKYHPDVIDLNFGCPVKKIAARGAGAGLLKDIPKMTEMTKRIVEAVKVPVTAKTRLGWDEKSVNIVEAAEKLQDAGIQAIFIHARTKTQMYGGQADWKPIGQVKKNPRMHIPVIGNGDIDSPGTAKAMFDTYKVDGIMIGRACIGKPWIFEEIRYYLQHGEYLPEKSLPEIVQIVRTHLQKSIDFYGERVGILLMRRHLAKCFKGLKNFRDTRVKLLTSENQEEITGILDAIARGERI